MVKKLLPLLLALALLLVAVPTTTAQDGRLNPRPDAPIAIYCTWDSIDVYWVNPWNGRGELVLEARFDEIFIDAQAGGEIMRANGVRMSFTENWAYKVEYPSQDGGIYQFWWYDCPLSYGEEGIYYPATGAFTWLGQRLP